MVQTVPFRGLRYTAPYTRATVFSPPYDVIDPEQRRRYLEGDAHNIVAIDLAPGAGDANWYAEAADTMARWLEEGVLAHDESPAFYGYRQHFSLGGREQVRTGYIGRVRLQEWGQGIHRHELTRVGPRADRLRLMQALHANTSPVFGMYRDPQGDIARHLEPPATTAVDVVDEDGVRHIFWPIVDPQTIAALSAAMADRDIVIADGHHRYETAMAYRAGRRAAEDDPVEPQPYDYVLMYLTAAEDPGLCILPTHRVIAATGGGGPDDA
ncbi:MAG TPA: DUF1015 domain-containing protein, partial [Chloroflexi bacterium]|nr:DUF1015 domain-containing protein [Chloroflexota bacterium]